MLVVTPFWCVSLEAGRKGIDTHCKRQYGPCTAYSVAASLSECTATRCVGAAASNPPTPNIERDGVRQGLARDHFGHDESFVGVEEGLGLVVETALAEMRGLEIGFEEELGSNRVSIRILSLGKEVMAREVSGEILVWRRVGLQARRRKPLGYLDAVTFAFQSVRSG